MDVYILDRDSAEKHLPTGKTAIVRIQNRKEHLHFPPLTQAKKYAQVITLTFDDKYDRGDPTGFTDALADELLDTFQPEGLDALVVHCTFGKNRSPAIAAGLGQTYGFADALDIAKRFPGLRQPVYQTLVEVATRKNLLLPPDPSLTMTQDEYDAFPDHIRYHGKETILWMLHARPQKHSKRPSQQ